MYLSKKREPNWTPARIEARKKRLGLEQIPMQEYIDTITKPYKIEQAKKRMQQK